jgi:hypothetical protein
MFLAHETDDRGARSSFLRTDRLKNKVSSKVAPEANDAPITSVADKPITDSDRPPRRKRRPPIGALDGVFMDSQSVEDAVDEVA